MDGKLESVEDRIADKIDSMEQKLEDLIKSNERYVDGKLESAEHRLADKMEFVKDHIKQRSEDKIEDKTESIKEDIEQKMNKLQGDSNNRGDSLVRLIQERLVLLENRLEDKIDNNNNKNNLNKLIQQDVKISSELDQFSSDIKADIMNILDTFWQRLGG